MTANNKSVKRPDHLQYRGRHGGGDTVLTAETIAEIRNCLQIIRGNAEMTKQLSTEGQAIHAASVTIATVDRIAKILEGEQDANEHNRIGQK